MPHPGEMKIFSIALLVFLSACGAQVPGPRVYGWIPFSSGGTPRGMSELVVSRGWTAFLDQKQPWETETALQAFQRLKPDVYFIWLPFGHDDCPCDFDFGGYSEVKKDPRFSKVADIDAFVKTHVEIQRQTGIQEFVFYYGYIGAIHDRWDLPAADKQKLVDENLEPIFRLKAAMPLGVKVRLVIDTAGVRPLGDENYTLVEPRLKEHGILFGGEPWPGLSSPYAKDPQYLFAVVDSFLQFIIPAWAYDVKDISAPIMPFMIGDGLTPDQEMDRAACDLKIWGNVAVQHWQIELLTSEIKRRALLLTNDCGKLYNYAEMTIPGGYSKLK